MKPAARSGRSARALTATVAAGLGLFAASPGVTAPTCQDRAGETIRCGAPGAMPVGWSPPPGDIARHSDGGPSPTQMFGLVLAIGSIFALIALLPPFDSARDGAWDAQEDDGDDQG
jgi:hypothetical protein